VEDYVQDLDDAEVLLDMISTAESFEKPTIKRTETLFPEVSPSSPFLDSQFSDVFRLVLLRRTDSSGSPVRHITLRNNNHIPLQFSRSNGLQPHRWRKTLPPYW